MNNKWNKMIYRIWTPFYDKVFNSGVFLKARSKVFEGLSVTQGQHVLFVGVGTGADLEYFNTLGVKITAIDLSPSMLASARARVSTEMDIRFIEMDAQSLDFPEQTFDLVIASLILSVVPDAKRCMGEISRVTKGEGTVLIFDKFETVKGKLSISKKLLRPLVSLLGTDIGRSFQEIIQPFNDQLKIHQDTPVMFNGMYRKIILEKVK
ncbi:class I SAM-dependent methyltransferase [Paenibacillus typhae]|uniref:Ubiquinone/menaquinone biosynthesis C-methylase UbiE n=1 Tax=Paenibacillus typhae TaxID=1174501 RepID=A0A1G8F9P3_9BACL|nr:class I SAM-dependent methyltransferase [Paenibacillus typhae]SDH78810.1 Ubiquinone/menaquinone biosynthesis C-methylase UbiE [Paenibacillus typhae]